MHGHWTYSEKMRLDGSHADDSADSDYLLWCETDDIDSAFESANYVDDVSDAKFLTQASV